MENLIFIKHRYKNKNILKKTSNEVHEELGDWSVNLNNLDEAKIDITNHVKKMFENEQKQFIEMPTHKIEWLLKLINDIQDDGSMEKFITTLINYSGILLKLHCKIFYKEFEYFYYDFKIWKAKYSPKIFIHKNLETDAEIVWQRSYPKKNFDYKNFKNNFTPETLNINTYEEFYKHYSDDNNKKKKFKKY